MKQAEQILWEEKRELAGATGNGNVWGKGRGRRANKRMVREETRQQYIGIKLKKVGIGQLQMPTELPVSCTLKIVTWVCLLGAC